MMKKKYTISCNARALNNNRLAFWLNDDGARRLRRRHQQWYKMDYELFRCPQTKHYSLRTTVVWKIKYIHYVMCIRLCEDTEAIEEMCLCAYI